MCWRDTTTTYSPMQDPASGWDAGVPAALSAERHHRVAGRQDTALLWG